MKKIIAPIFTLSIIFIVLSSFDFNDYSSKHFSVKKIQELEKGKKLYNDNCAMCHQPNGEGFGTNFPPLAKSDYLNADPNRAIRIVINGMNEPIVVNGKNYENAMIPHKNFSDQDVADVLNFVYANWGNNKTKVTAEMVKKQRGEK